MAGILDLFNTPQVRFGLGLLAAAAPRADRVGFGERMMDAVDSVDTWKEKQKRAKLAEMQMQQAQMQIEEAQRKTEETNRQRKWQEGLLGVMGQKSYGASDVGPTMGPDTQALNDYMLSPDSPYRSKLLERSLFPEKPEAYTLGEGQVRYQGNQIVAQGPAKKDPNIAQLEIIYGVGTPELKAALKRYGDKMTTHAPAATAISYGSPVPVELGGGGIGYVQPANRPGAAPQMMLDPLTNKPFTKPKDTGNRPAELQRMDLAGKTMAQLLNDYETFISANNPRDPMVSMNPTKRAQMESLHKNIQLQYKELQALGALAGPDLAIMEAALSDPFSVKGAYYGKDGLKAQIKQARKLIELRTAPNPTGNPSDDSDPLGLRRK